MINRRSLFSLFAGAAVAAPAVTKISAQSVITTKPGAEPTAADALAIAERIATHPGAHTHTFVTVSEPVHTHTFPSSDLPSGSHIWFFETVPDGWKFVRYGGDPRAILCEKL